MAMGRRPLLAVTRDFADVMGFFQQQGLVPTSPGAALLTHARRIHLATYSLILWRFRLIDLPQHGSPFIEEIASDALQILPHTLMGYMKSAKLFTRGIIENVLRHIYFSDHPIEFARMNREKRWYLTQDALQDYAKIHPTFLVSEPKFNAIAKLSSLYSDLSAGIHGRTVGDLEMKVALEKIKYDDDLAAEQADFVSHCAAASNFLLAAFHKERVLKFQTDDRRIILRTLPADARQVWGDL
jgi:hypothetical protein